MTKKKEIIDLLQQFRFTRIEAQVYLTLIEKGVMNGSQIARILALPRTSVYSALDALFKRGIIFQLQGTSVTEYRAKDPERVFEEIEKEIIDDAEVIKRSLSDLQSNDFEDNYWNITGEDNVVIKIREIIDSAEEEIIINMNYDIFIFEDEIRKAVKRGVRIILFTFELVNAVKLPIEVYHNSAFGDKPGLVKRIMIVVDNNEAFVAGGQTDSVFGGTFSRNKLFVDIISEHIHQDIYIFRKESEEKKRVITPELLIDSLHEKEFREIDRE